MIINGDCFYKHITMASHIKTNYMKKGLLLMAASIAAFNAFAQNSANIFAAGPTGSFITGHSSNTTRTDNNIVATNSGTPRRGYAVFDLGALPSTAVVTSVRLHFNMAVVTAGGGFGWNTRGHAGDLSTITAPGTLYTTMGLAGTIWNTNYPTTPTNVTFGSNGAAVGFVSANIGNKVSIVWSTNSTRTYTITGESGTTTTTGTHAPYLEVNYTCPGITSITADGPATNPCPNAAFSLSGNATGTIASYSWTGPFGFTSTDANPTITTGLPANGSYTLEVTDVNGCSAKAVTVVTVTPAPASDIIAMTAVAFCDADSATLSAVTPGMNYQWYNGTAPIAGATDQQYVTYASGNYKVEVTNPGTGCTSITSVSTNTVLLSTPPVSPAGPILLCIGDNGTLSVNTNGVTAGINFQWQKDGVNIPGAGSVSYVAGVSGTYRLVLTVPATGCTATSNEVSVVVNENPIPVITFSGSNLNTVGAYTTYQWFLNTVAIPGATSATYHPTTAGSYRVRVSDIAGCTAFSTPVLVTTVSIDDVAATNIRLYPNPVNGKLQVSGIGSVNCIVSTVDGKVLVNSHNTNEIDFSHLPDGLYLVTILNPETGEKLTTQKITKQ